MIYFAIFLIGCACLFISPVYWPQNTLSLIFLSAGVGVISTQVRIAFKNLPERVYSLLIAIPLMLCALIVPFPYNLGFLLLSAGIILVVIFPSQTLLSRFSFSLMITGAMLAVVSLLNPLFDIIVGRCHDFGMVNFFVHPLLRLLNLETLWE
jgi:hypothetical protein